MEQFAKRHCTCTLGEHFQDQAELVLEPSRQKHANLLVKDCFRWGWWPYLVTIDGDCSLSLLLLKFEIQIKAW